MPDKEIINTMHLDDISENFVSHSDEPQVGDAVVNNNPKCKHFESEGIVINIESLPEDKGKTVTYKCTNTGDSWAAGDLLTKTMDQLMPQEDVDRVVAELMQNLLSTENEAPEDQLRAVIDEMIKIDGPGNNDLIITSPHEAHILDEEYITAVLGLQVPLNEAYPYTPQFRHQVLNEQRLLEGFFSGLVKVGGEAKTLMAAIGTIIKDKSQIGDFVKRIKTGVIDEPLASIREFLGNIYEKLKEWGMKAFTKIADAAKKVLDFVEKQVKKIFSMGGWKQALSICGLGLAIAFLWKKIGTIVETGAKKLAQFGGVMADMAKGALGGAAKGMEAIKIESLEDLPTLSDAVYSNEYRLDEFGFLSSLFGDGEEEEEPTGEEVAEIDQDGDGEVTPEEVAASEEDPEKKEKKKEKNKKKEPSKFGLAIAAGEEIPKDGVFLSLDQAKEAGLEAKTSAEIKAAKADAAVKKAEDINKLAKKGEKQLTDAEKAYEENKDDVDAVVEEMPEEFTDKMADFLEWCNENIVDTVGNFVQDMIGGAAKDVAVGAVSGGVGTFVKVITKLYGGIKFVSSTLAPHLKGFGKDVKAAVADAKTDPEAVADDLKTVGESVLRNYIRETLIKKKTRVRGYLKPASSFHTLAQWEAVVNQLLKLQEEGIDTRGGKIRSDQRLLTIINEYFGYLLTEEVPRWEHLTTKNVLDFIEDFVNHRFWGLEKEFGHYFPDISRLKFAYFYSRGDIEPYVLLDEEYTTQLYGSTHNPKELLHYTSADGLERLSTAIRTGKSFDISTFTVAERPFFRPESNIIVHLSGNVRAGFRSDIKSMAVDSGRRACNLYRLEYPGKDINNICDELESCDGSVRTSLWNEYIATPIEILDVYEMVSEE